MKNQRNSGHGHPKKYDQYFNNPPLTAPIGDFHNNEINLLYMKIRL